ncbi:hypothetical protein [Aeromicrobium sp. UC242_57]|uniref:hypothetical protein n=1 Tax=Aeromicrobium sp. UC242_57 TaxID=3374624 RepID=UPI0037A2834B
MKRLNENCIVGVKNRSFTVTAKVEVTEPGPSGVLIAQGGSYGGWSFYAHDGRLAFCYNTLAVQTAQIYSDAPLDVGSRELRAHFAYDGGGLGRGGIVTLYDDDVQIGEGRVERTIPFTFSLDETLDIGMDVASPVSPSYGPRDNAFSGTIDWVRIDAGDDDHNHLIEPEHRMQAAMVRQ